MERFLPKKETFLTTLAALVGWKSPADHDFGWFSQGNLIFGGETAGKQVVTQHWYWLVALKNDTWGWLDNNFIFGVGKEDFSMVGKRLVKR